MANPLRQVCTLTHLSTMPRIRTRLSFTYLGGWPLTPEHHPILYERRAHGRGAMLASALWP